MTDGNLSIEHVKVLENMTGYEFIQFLRVSFGEFSDHLAHAAFTSKFDVVDNIVNQMKAWNTVDNLIPSQLDIERLKAEAGEPTILAQIREDNNNG